jgi:hypothetical protein
VWTPQLIEVMRFGADASEITKDAAYLVRRGQEPAREYRMPLTADDVLDYLDDLRDELQEAQRRDEGARRATRELVVGAVSAMLDVPGRTAPLQVDLVVNPREIAALPFEAARGEDGAPLFAGRDPSVLLTRRIRAEFPEQPTAWPAAPRILFVTAQPEAPVPADGHLAALQDALRPWIEPYADIPGAYRDVESVMTHLRDASLEAIADTCRGAGTRPYTHVHVLAHGSPVRTGRREKWGVALHGRDGATHAVTAEALAVALCAGEAPPAVVTLTVCDSANAGAAAVAGASPAHALQTAGVPVVLASQLPMTWEGSVVLAASFYGALLRGTDVRDAIQRTRDALYAERERCRHDWVGLVAYVRLPPGYEGRLLDVVLAADLAAMETASTWADHLVRQEGPPVAVYDDVAASLESRIATLEGRLDACARAGRHDVLREARGLRASAYKRLAELLFRRAEAAGDDAVRASSHAALEQARGCYTAAADADLGAHWLAVQALSLEAVLDGRIAPAWRWDAAMHAAQADATDAWACGSRAELWLLAPYAGRPAAPEAAAAALRELVAAAGGTAAYEWKATRRQLRRYVDWWTPANGYFGGTAGLGEAATLLVAAADG